LSSEKQPPLSLLALSAAFCYQETSSARSGTIMHSGNWFYAGFFFGFTGYFGRPARGLVC
jgi:hypothetical protein